MATTEQIDQVRLNIDDLNDDDFSQLIKEQYIDEKNSVNWASWQLTELLIVRLRKDTLEKDISGTETTEFYSLKERLELMKSIAKKYENAYQDEIGNSTGRYICTKKPIIAGGLV